MPAAFSRSAAERDVAQDRVVHHDQPDASVALADKDEPVPELPVGHRLAEHDVVVNPRFLEEPLPAHHDRFPID